MDDSLLRLVLCLKVNGGEFYPAAVHRGSSNTIHEGQQIPAPLTSSQPPCENCAETARASAMLFTASLESPARLSTLGRNHCRLGGSKWSTREGTASSDQERGG